MKALILKTRNTIIYVYGKKYKQLCCTIAKQLGCSKSSIPKKRTGCLPFLNTPFQQEL